MKFEFDDQDVKTIARQVAEHLRNELTGNVSSSSDIMDVTGLAEMLKVSKDWVYKQVQYKSIPYFKAGKFPRFKRKEIEDWIAAQSLPSTKETYPRLKSVKLRDR